MPRPKRDVNATISAFSTPPDILPDTHQIVRVIKAAGSNLYLVSPPQCATSKIHSDHSASRASTGDDIRQLVPARVVANDNMEELLVEMPVKARGVIMIRNGMYLVVDRELWQGQGSKIKGEIVSIVLDVKQWRKMPYWPVEFDQKARADEGSEALDDSDSG